MRWPALPMLLALATFALGCEDDTPAPSVRATCERLTELCGELYGFEEGQCLSEAQMGVEPTATERRCIGRADSCDQAFGCRMGDGGVSDAGAPPLIPAEAEGDEQE